MINQVNDALGFHQKALALRAYRQSLSDGMTIRL